MAAGVDVTWGLLRQLTQALDVNPAELEERETLRWDVSAEGRVQRARRQMQSMGRISKSLEQLPVFKQAGACLPRVLWVWVWAYRLTDWLTD